MAIFTTLRGEIHNSIQHKLKNSMEVDSVAIIAILSMSYITTRIVKTWTSVEKIPRGPVENQITTLGVVKIAIKFSPCKLRKKSIFFYIFRKYNILRVYCKKFRPKYEIFTKLQHIVESASRLINLVKFINY